MQSKNLFHFFQWRFLQLSIFLVVLPLIAPLLTERWLLKFIIVLVLLNSILVLLSTYSRVKLLKYSLFSLISASLVCSIISLYAQSEIHIRIFDFLETFFNLALLAIISVSIMLFVFNNSRISIDSIFAAFSVYLMIGLSFSLIYHIIESTVPGSFKFPGDYAGSFPELSNNLFYFSMVTIATLGYGDIVPVTQVARAFSVLEAVIGQFFVAVVVAMLVGKLISSEKRT